jgi:ketosteroid isomerase-like protein
MPMAFAVVGDDVESSEAVVRTFIERINDHDVAGIVAMCTNEHRFIDSLGQALKGREQLRRAWSDYLQLFSDYRIEVETLIAAGSTVLVAGEASAMATVHGSKAPWRIPAAWRAEVEVDLVDLWQVYADNKPVYELLAHDG